MKHEKLKALAVIALYIIIFYALIFYVIPSPTPYKLSSNGNIAKFINEQETPIVVSGTLCRKITVNSFIDLDDDVTIVNISGKLSLVDHDRNIWRGTGTITVCNNDTKELEQSEGILFTGILTVEPRSIFSERVKPAIFIILLIPILIIAGVIVIRD